MPTTHAGPAAGTEAPRPSTEELLQRLPAQHREIIVATYFRRRTATEAARLLGLPPAAAKARLYAAMRDLSLMIEAGR
jgi:RNA polymerase sigma-70 factor (ECF subfamily)